MLEARRQKQKVDERGLTQAPSSQAKLKMEPPSYRYIYLYYVYCFISILYSKFIYSRSEHTVCWQISMSPSGVSKVGTSSTQTRLCQQLKLPVDRSIVYISMLNSFKFVSL